MKQLLALLSVVTALLAVACPYAPPDVEVEFSGITADGSDGTEGSPAATSSVLTLIFNQDIADLSLDDIVFNGGDTGAVKGELSRIEDETGIYELTITGITASGTVVVGAAKSGYAITPRTHTVHVHFHIPPVEVAFTRITANGSTETATTAITLTFDKDIEGLTAADITFNAGDTGAVAGAFTRTGTGTYTLAVGGIARDGEAGITVHKDGFIITPDTHSAEIFAEPGPAVVNVTFVGPTERIIPITQRITNFLARVPDQLGTITMTIDEDFDRVEWYVGETKAGEGKTITLTAIHPAFVLGHNWITVIVYEGTGGDAIPWSGSFMVTVITTY